MNLLVDKLESMQSKEETEKKGMKKNKQSLRKMSDTFKNSNIHQMEVPYGNKKGRENNSGE